VLELNVDRGRCQGARECVQIAPASVRIDATMTAVPIAPAGDPESAIFEAVRSCPNNAIRVFRDGAEISAIASDRSRNG